MTNRWIPPNQLKDGDKLLGEWRRNAVSGETLLEVERSEPVSLNIRNLISGQNRDNFAYVEGVVASSVRDYLEKGGDVARLRISVTDDFQSLGLLVRLDGWTKL